MSVLSYPRINFKGVFRTNPCTSNNDDVMPAMVARDTDALGADLAGMTDAEAMAFLREQVSMSNTADDPCIAFIRSGWNLYGDHTTSFEQTIVTSVVTGPPAPGRLTSPADDPLVGQGVVLLGSVSDDPMRRGAAILCDLDATGLVTTQLWIGGLQLGSGGASGTDPSQIIVQLNHDTRAFQNWLHFFATTGPYTGEQNFVGIGCLMQFALPASAIPSSVSFDSPGLQAVLAAGRAAAGLVVRFRCFEVQPGITDENLSAAFQQGQGLANPAFGYIVGTIGIRQPGEPETEPVGRKLTCPYPRQSMAYADPQGNNQVSLPPQEKPWTPKLPPALTGNAVAAVQPGASVISLDLVNAFPKYGFRDPQGPQMPGAGGFGAPRAKADLGTLALVVFPADGSAPQTIASVDYGLGDYSTYEDFGGIVDIAFDPDLAPLIAAGTLAIQGTPASALNPGRVLLQESPITVVTDDRTLYLMPGRGTTQVRVKLYERGGPVSAPTPLYLYEYANIIEQHTDTPKDGKPTPCHDGIRPNQTVAQEAPGILMFKAQVTVPAGGGFDDWFTIDVTPTGSGATILAYQLDSTKFGTGNPDGVAGVPVWSYATYSSIRVFADQDYSALYTDGVLRWEDVYNTVLRYYYLLFPAMSAYIPLNLADSVVQNGALLGQRLHTPAEPGFYTTYNMPLTRSMPPAKVRLVLDFIRQQQAKSS